MSTHALSVCKPGQVLIEQQRHRRRFSDGEVMASRSIIVIDDDPDTCASFSDVLSDLRYEADVAHGGPEALQLVHRRSYRLALIDFRLPGMTGVELFRQICQVRAGIAAFLVTAYATSEASDVALVAGVRRVLNKPVDIPSLLLLLESALAESATS